MTALKILDAVLTYGPTIIPLAQKLVADINAGRGDKPLTDADFVELTRLATQTSADIYARLNVVPPPSK